MSASAATRMRAASRSALTSACVAPGDCVLHKSKELDHVTVDEREVNRLVSLAPHRTQAPVRPLRMLTRRTAG